MINSKYIHKESNKNLDINKIQNTLKKLGMVEASEVEKIKKENEILKKELIYFNNNESERQDLILEKEILLKKKDEMNILMEKYKSR